MSALSKAYVDAYNPIRHFIAVDAAQFIALAGTNPDLSQDAPVTAYKQMCNMSQPDNQIDIIALDEREAQLAHAMLGYLAVKTRMHSTQPTIKLLHEVDQGFYSVFVTDRPESFGGKVQAHSVSYPQSTVFHRHFSK